MTINEKIEIIRLKTESLLGQYQIENVRIRFDLKGRSAGQARWVNGLTKAINFQIRYNVAFFQNNFEEMLNRTVPHEVAHIIEVVKYGRASHGYNWSSIMRQLGADPARCHNYDMSVVYQNAVKCSCKVHHVTKNLYNKIRAGSGHHCSRCKTQLYVPISKDVTFHPTDSIQIAAQTERKVITKTKVIDYKSTCLDMIKAGKSKNEVIQVMVSWYVDKKGKTLVWALKRSSVVYAHMIKEVK